MIYRVINKCIALYKNRAERMGKDSLGQCGENVVLAYPFILGEPEAISIGDDTTILAGSRLQVYNYLSEEKATIKIGKHCYITHRFCILAGADITIGDDVLIASDVTIVSEEHSFDPEDEIPYMDQKSKSAPVVIRRGTWIGQKVTVLPGVTIGERCVIGAGAVVTKDIPAYSVAVGNPAKVIKRFDFEQHKWVRQ